MSKFDAIEKLLKEVHEFKIAKSNIQVIHTLL